MGYSETYKSVSHAFELPFQKCLKTYLLVKYWNLKILKWWKYLIFVHFYPPNIDRCPIPPKGKSTVLSITQGQQCLSPSLSLSFSISIYHSYSAIIMIRKILTVGNFHSLLPFFAYFTKKSTKEMKCRLNINTECVNKKWQL